MVSPAANHILATPPKLQSSFSANDISTVKSSGGSSGMAVTANNHAQQHFHNHNASLGRIPAGVMPNRHSRELSNDGNFNAARETTPAYPSIGSTLQANAAPFGPASSQPQHNASTTAITSPTSVVQYHYYNGAAYNNSNGNGAGYNVPMLAMTMQGMSLNGNSNSLYSNANFAGYGPLYAQHSLPRDSQARVIQTRRQMDSEGKQFLTPHGYLALLTNFK
jgi:hypothetical protein